MTTTTVTKSAAPEVIFAEAAQAAKAAFDACAPTPMVVGEAKAIFGPGSSDIDYSKPTYYVADGVCGFAWVRIRPARGKFVAWCKANGIGHKGYYGGWEVASWEFGAGRSSQSYQRAYAAAAAAARVLASYGITAYEDGRLD